MIAERYAAVPALYDAGALLTLQRPVDSGIIPAAVLIAPVPAAPCPAR
jgi:hypothetical protein